MATDMSHTATPPPDALSEMKEAALQAGDLLVAASKRRSDLNITEKTAGDFVSDADLGAEAVIRAQLNGTYGWIGEESGDQTGGNTGLRWIVDPLDGTTNFLKGLPHWAVSIALCDGDDPICAVVHDPVKNETFTAESGKGAYLNDAPIHVSTGIALSAAIFATGVPAGGRVTYLSSCLQDLENLMPQTAGIRRWGAASLDLAYVAAGRLEGYWERNLGPWDIAAGSLLVREAGGHVTPLWDDMTVLQSGSFIASNADLGPTLASYIDQTRRHPPTT
jgi:myo-inositol-1(or 4)-monophosphatase